MKLHVEVRRTLMVTLGTLLFSIGVSLFIVPANLIPGGLSGFARLSQYLIETTGFNINLGFIIV
ncbi:MAG: YitT family protein, partial [Bacillota bacterium]